MTIQIFLLEDLFPHAFPNYRTSAVNIKGKESQMLGFCLKFNSLLRPTQPLVYVVGHYAELLR